MKNYKRIRHKYKMKGGLKQNQILFRNEKIQSPKIKTAVLTTAIKSVNYKMVLNILSAVQRD